MKLEIYRRENPFSLWKEKENAFKKQNSEFTAICKILAITINYNYERRVALFKDIHPLAIQVDLKTGVANGVLVVRNEEDCAELIYRIFTNKLYRKGHSVKKEDHPVCLSGGNRQRTSYKLFLEFLYVIMI